MSASRIRLAIGAVWTFLNVVDLRRVFSRIWQPSAGYIWRFELVLLFVVWWTVAAAVLGVVIIHDLRRTLRQQMTGAHLGEAPLSGEGGNV
jgi:hypothetical protein